MSVMDDLLKCERKWKQWRDSV